MNQNSRVQPDGVKGIKAIRSSSTSSPTPDTQQQPEAMQSPTKTQQQPPDDQWQPDTTQSPGEPPDAETPEKLRANCHQSLRPTTNGYSAKPSHALTNQETKVIQGPAHGSMRHISHHKYIPTRKAKLTDARCIQVMTNFFCQLVFC